MRSEIEAFPDLRMVVELAVAQGDFVTMVWRFRGTHTAFGYGLPPTGARIEMRGITVWRIVDGKIRDEWTSFNELTAYMQVLRHLSWFLFSNANFYSRSHDAVIRVYDEAGNVIETLEQA